MTNAHIADILLESNNLYAIDDDSGHMFRVAQVWYHPRQKFAPDNPTLQILIAGGDSPDLIKNVDVAILKLCEDDTCDFVNELKLAEEDGSYSDRIHEEIFYYDLNRTKDHDFYNVGHGVVSSYGTIRMIERFDEESHAFLLHTTLITELGDSGSPFCRKSDNKIIGVITWKDKRYQELEDGRFVLMDHGRASGISVHAIYETLRHNKLTL